MDLVIRTQSRIFAFGCACPDGKPVFLDQEQATDYATVRAFAPARFGFRIPAGQLRASFD